MPQDGKVYVVTSPDSVRGIYETWEACKAAITGTSGVRHQSVSSRAKAEAMLSGEGVRLRPGWYAFTDGSGDGGVGIVLVEQGLDGELAVVEEGTSVGEIFRDAGVRGLESGAAVADALGSLRNVLAEMAALYQALRLARPGIQLTVVHDYEGVAAWLEGRWKAAEHPIVRAVVEACGELIVDRRLEVVFHQQPGHQSTWAGRDDYAHWNGRADRLAAGDRP